MEGSLLETKNRGGLMRPSSDVVKVAARAMALVEALTWQNSDVVRNATALPTSPFAADINVTEPPSSRAVTITSPIITFLAGIVGNIIALAVLRRTRADVSRGIFYVLVGALVVTDLVGQLLTTPIPLLVYVNGLRWVGGDGVCRAHAFVMMCAGLMTPAIVCTMAVERYMCLKRPYFYQTNCTRRRARVYLAALCAFTVLLAACPLLGWGATALQYPGTWCFVDSSASRPADVAYTYVYALYTLATIGVTVWCNVAVIGVLLKLRRRRTRENSPSEQTNFGGGGGSGGGGGGKRPRGVEMQMVVLLVAITLTFIVCWSPLMIEIILSQSSGLQHQHLSLMAIRLASINQILDPWLYILFRKTLLVRMREALLAVVRSFTCCYTQAPPREDSLSDTGKQAPPIIGFQIEVEVPKPVLRAHTPEHMFPKSPERIREEALFIRFIQAMETAELGGGLVSSGGGGGGGGDTDDGPSSGPDVNEATSSGELEKLAQPPDVNDYWVEESSFGYSR
ncbi:PREDICTED: prostaglandin E2 receptor EP4 subtype-like [Priapulus caudatus]|uniref:Thromboxane A2 receptor n=1 Tax=Priapulus caudatus TaxID=37621 RepID=A0ABM1EEW9_PRICU|nr:PREDICTED: prostaglandin E2 receptor EP4 subtype-like [Priapulus caudatus]